MVCVIIFGGVWIRILRIFMNHGFQLGIIIRYYHRKRSVLLRIGQLIGPWDLESGFFIKVLLIWVIRDQSLLGLEGSIHLL